MANRSSYGGVVLDVDPYQLAPESELLREVEASPSLRVLVMGDFSGQATGKLIRIDRDNLEATLAGFAPHLELPLGNGQLGGAVLTFASLEDFEPDSLYRRSDLFAALRDGTGGGPLYSEPEESQPAAPLQPTPEQMERLTSPGGLLDAIVEQSSAYRERVPEKFDEFQSMVERIVAPYALPAESAESRRASTERNQQLSLLMAHILHNEQFQALEAAWRGLDLMVRVLETDEIVHLYLLDCSKETLCARLQDAVQGTTGRWEMLVGNFAFDRASLADVEMLERIGLLAKTLGAPFLAECLPSQEDDASAEAAWQALRKAPSAPYIGLALPRFLLRVPYGRESAPVAAFAFEEMPGDPVHGDYLWGNPAFACAMALGELFERQGSLMRLPANLLLSAMPLHIFRAGGEACLRPCTEVLLTEDDCLTLLKSGVLPLAGVKSSDEILFPRMLSIADPAAKLAFSL
jgi:type VI secretion system protein ImpC